MNNARRKPYPFDQIEPKWQAIWDERQLFHAPNPGEKNFDPAKPKFYILDMFPYPSGAGLHVGHPEGYTATDIIARYKRMRGFNVLHPMGWDAFGLPAEQYAIKSGQHPAITTRENVAKFKAQLKRIGFSYDWQREINTTDPSYYKWTQWIFFKLYSSWFDPDKKKARPISELIEKFNNDETEPDIAWRTAHESRRSARLDSYRLAYVMNAPVWWCERLGTVLANEEVVDGKSEIGGFPVARRPMRQWMLRITAYADRLIDELEGLDWPESIKLLQRNWIGRSEGAEIDFKIDKTEEQIRVFTTRPDTLYGATYMVLAPENKEFDDLIPAHWPKKTKSKWKWASPLNPKDAIDDYRNFIASLSDLQRTMGKTGIFSGFFALNPVTNEPIPVFFSEYVLSHYGTGAIMGVPAHDERDLEFAREHELPIVSVVGSLKPFPSLDFDQKIGYQFDEKSRLVRIGKKDEWVFFSKQRCFTGEGVAINSPVIDGLTTAEAKKRITAWLEERGQGKAAINYKLRDWLFSRQRYWGEPFPVVWEEGKHRTISEEELPLILPEIEDYKPTGTGEPPLAKAKDWVRYSDKAVRETNTMPQWAGSCWYYLRFCDPQNDQRFVGEEAERYWMGGNKPGGVDLYVGGTEHAVLHLLYARFWHKVLFDLGYLSKSEPFQRLVNQGIVLGEDNQKMSKSRGNIVNPDDVIDQYGADAFRCYEMFMGPLEQMKPWSMRGVEGVARFLARVWRLLMTENQAGGWELSAKLKDVDPDRVQQKITHATIKKVTQDIESLSFNTAISQMMIFVNAFINTETIPLLTMRTFLVLLNPFAPHLTSEVWEKLNAKFQNNIGEITEQKWPGYDEQFLVEDEVEIVVQVNGKVRATMKFPVDATEEEVKAAAFGNFRIQQFVLYKQIRKIVFVPNKLINMVT